MARGLTAIFGAMVIAAALLATGVAPDPVLAQDASTAKPKKAKGLKGSIGYRRAYSYSKSDIVGSDSRRFYDPSLTRQTPGGPFDSGFFFDSGIGRNGGESPYMQ